MHEGNFGFSLDYWDTYRVLFRFSFELGAIWPVGWFSGITFYGQYLFTYPLFKKNKKPFPYRMRVDLRKAYFFK